MDDLIISTMLDGEGDSENLLRPKTMDEYIGQETIKNNLMVYIQATKKRGDNLDHVLLYGPPGLGKTTLAHIISNELGVPITVTSGTAIPTKFEMSAILSKLQHNEVLFIDEIHRLPSSLEEILYPAMEDFKLDFVTGKGLAASSVNVPVEKFTLIGATTKAGNLAAPLRDRFGMQMRLVPYTQDELKQIVINSARRLHVEIEDEAALEIAKRSRQTPRIANRILRRVRDFAEVFSGGVINLEITKLSLERMQIDPLGLDSVDKNLIVTLITKFNGGPVGLNTLASATGEDALTIEEVYEPYLMQLGFIARSPRGRVCMPNAYKHYKIKPTKEQMAQMSLFDLEENENK